jgi:hypothetical protein
MKLNIPQYIKNFITLKPENKIDIELGYNHIHRGEKIHMNIINLSSEDDMRWFELRENGDGYTWRKHSSQNLNDNIIEVSKVSVIHDSYPPKEGGGITIRYIIKIKDYERLMRGAQTLKWIHNRDRDSDYGETMTLYIYPSPKK